MKWTAAAAILPGEAEESETLLHLKAEKKP